MFDIVSSAAAESIVPGVDLPGLGPYPILQTFGGIAVLALGILMWLRGERQGQKKPSENTGEGEVHMHFDGPMVEALAQLKRIADTASEMPKAAEQLAAFAERLHKFREDCNAEIERSRHKTAADIQRDVIVRFEKDIDEIEKRLRNVEQGFSEMRGVWSAIGELKHMITSRRRTD